MRYIYIDVVRGDLDFLGEGERYALDGEAHGYCFRGIGKNSIRAAIYRGKMPDSVDSFFLEEELELTYVLSSFGDFGSVAIFDLVDSYGVKIRDRRSANGLATVFHCRVIAFPLRCFPYLQMAPQMVTERTELNEIEFINEFRQMGFRSDRWYQLRADCFPCIELYVPRLEGERLSDMIGLPDSKLRALDAKGEYYCSVAPKASDAEVFISYSSKDQAVADRIVDAVRLRGIGCSIASDSIHAGSYARQIVQGIRRAKLFGVVLSGNAIASPHVKSELDIATGRIRETRHHAVQDRRRGAGRRVPLLPVPPGALPGPEAAHRRANRAIRRQHRGRAAHLSREKASDSAFARRGRPRHFYSL